MREVEHLITHARDPIIRRHVGDSHRKLRDRRIGRHLEMQHRCTQHRQLTAQGWCVEHQSTAVVEALIRRLLPGAADPHPLPGRLAMTLRRADAEHRAALLLVLPEASVPTQMQAAEFDIGRRVRTLADPVTRCECAGALGGYRILEVRPQHRLIHDPRILTLEPVIPPAHRLLQVADRRSRDAIMRIKMAPGTDDAEPRHLEALEESRYSVCVSVRPAADRQYGALDRREILADRAMLPVVVVTLVGEPQRSEERRVGKECRSRWSPY